MWFTGWTERTFDVPAQLDVLPSAQPQTWLLAQGWKQAKPISLYEVPGPR